MKNINDMKPMEKYWYLTQNRKDCACCKKNKSYNSFYLNDNLNEICNFCQKKKYEKEVIKIVLGVLKNTQL